MNDRAAQSFAQTVVMGLSDTSGIVVRDLAALVVEQRENSSDPSKDDSILQPVRDKLSGNGAANNLLDTIGKAAKGAVSFGPVVAGSIAAGHRLELLMRLGKELAFRPPHVLQFIRASDEANISQLQVAELAQDVFENRLNGPNPLANRWRDWVVPSLLQMPRITEQGSFDDIELVQAATGGDLPVGWTQKISDWLEDWVKQHTDLSSDSDIDGDITGLFKPDVPDFRPAALHPLVLRILRKQFNARLDLENDAFDEPMRRYCRWLKDRVFEGNGVLDGATPEVAFAAGMLVLDLAMRFDRGVTRNRGGVRIFDDGTVRGVDSDPFWVDMAESVLASIVRNSEQTNSTVAGWRNKQDTVSELLQTCPEWRQLDISLNLRERAKNRLGQALTDVVSSLQEHLTTDAYMPAQEAFERLKIPELRPNRSIIEEVNLDKNPDDKDFWKGQRKELSKQLKAYADAGQQAAKSAATAKQLADAASASRNTFARRFASPLARTVFAHLADAQGIPAHATQAAFLRRQLAEIHLHSTADGIGEPLDKHPAWVSAINKTLTSIQLGSDWPAQMRLAWARLEGWDGLRGRLRRSGADDNELEAGTLLQNKLPWLSSNEAAVTDNLDGDRPTLAAVVHLGLQRDDFTKLATRLEALLDGSIPDTVRPLLTAGRIELGLTAMASGATASEAFSQLDDVDATKLTELLSWANTALESSNAWETRAGFNLLTFLARFAEASGDLFLAVNLAENLNQSTSRATQIITDTLDLLISGTTGSATSPGSGLPLALVAFDLLRYTREIAAGIIPASDIPAPGWLQAGATAESLIDDIHRRILAQDRKSLSPFAAEGGIAAKLLLLTLLDIKLSALTLQQRLLTRPLRHDEIEPLIKLQGVVRSVMCSQELLLRGIEESAPSPYFVPWWKPHYWSALAADADALEREPVSDSVPHVPFSEDILNDLNGERVPKPLLDAFELQVSGNPLLRIRVPHDAARQQQGQWLLLDGDEQGRVLLIQAEYNASGAEVFAISRLRVPFRLFNWADAYDHAADALALALAANLEAAIPTLPPASTDNYYSDQLFKDIDGRYEGEFPAISYKAAHERLDKSVKALAKQEDTFRDAIKDQNQDIRTEEIANLLKLPLRLSTADYQEQLQAALADVREAEADLEVAEHGSLASEFEQFAAGFMYEAARVESERQTALIEIERCDKQIKELEVKVQNIEQDLAEQRLTDQEYYVKLAENAVQRGSLLKEKVENSCAAIKQEIELIRKLLGGRDSDTPEELNKYKVNVKLADGTMLGDANGQIAALGLRVGHVVGQQLEKELREANQDLADAREKEKARKKKEKRRRLVDAACRFIGAAVGAYLGGPAGATLGAEIGSALAEVSSGMSENNPPQEILVGLIDNSFTIAGAAGYDLEKNLNSLSAKGTTELTEFIKGIDTTLAPLIKSMPKVFDDQIVKGAFEVLDLEEVPELATLVDTTYSNLQSNFEIQDPKLGTALKNTLKEGEQKAFIQFQDPKQLLDHMSNHLKNTLSANTQGNIEQMQALAKTLDDKVEDLTGNGPGARQQAAERLAGKLSKVVVAKIGQEAENYRRDIVRKWTQKQRDDGNDWSEVREEGEALLREFFSDPQTIANVTANLKASLVPKDVIRGQIQQKLQPWQKELDKRLDEIMTIPDNKPNSALEAAKQRVTYLTDVEKMFREQLLPWMAGTGNTQRDELLVKLNDLEREELKNALDIKISDIETTMNNLNLEKAKNQLETARNEIEAATKKVLQAEANVNKASWQNQAAELSKAKFAKEEDAKNALGQAAKEKALAAQANIKSAKNHLDSCRALAQAAERRGVEASGIRSALSQPPLRLPYLSRSAIARARAGHQERLNDAFYWYREVKRYLHSLGFVDKKRNSTDMEIPTLEPPGVGASSTWSSCLDNWLKQVGDSFLDVRKASVSGYQSINWELTPEQIKSLLSLSGFSLVVTGHVPEDPFLFAITEKPESSALFSELVNNTLSASFWREAFAAQGLHLSEDLAVVEIISGKEWKIIDGKPGPVTVQTYDESGEKMTEWPITGSKLEPVAFTIRFEEDGLIRYNVHLRQKGPFGSGRSAFADRYFEKLTSDQVKTGRLCGIFLIAKSVEEDYLTEADYSIQVEHLGDLWLNSKKLQLREKRTLKEHRGNFINSDDDLDAADLGKKLDDLVGANEGDPDPFVIQGTPLAGTTVIRLVSTTNKVFERAKLHVLYKFYQ